MSFLRKLFVKRCANCGREIKGKIYTWRGKHFCSERCKKEYRRKHKRRSKKGELPKDTFQAIYWR